MAPVHTMRARRGPGRPEKYDAAEPLLIEGYEGMKSRETEIPTYRRKDLTAAAGENCSVLRIVRPAGKSEHVAQEEAREAPPTRISPSPEGWQGRPHLSS